MGLYTLGIMFFFDRALLLLANLAFLAGLYCFVGITGTIGFFTKKGIYHIFKNYSGKLNYSVIYFAGFAMIIFRFSFFGALVQIYGLFMLFKSFLPFLFEWMYSVPVIGPFLSNYFFLTFLRK